jgi:hypothetical protein
MIYHVVYLPTYLDAVTSWLSVSNNLPSVDC